jgi:hypothetical protein
MTKKKRLPMPRTMTTRKKMKNNQLNRINLT